MNDNSFVKLFNTIITSSIWEEDNETRILWITMLALANRDGVVLAAPKRLAKLANIPVNKCQQCLQTLSAPDVDSRTPDNEGRRIGVVPGGWRILNYALYREKGRSLARNEYLRDKKREEPAKKKAVNKCQQVSTMSTDIEAEAEAEADTNRSCAPCATSCTGFDEFWEKYPKKQGKGAAKKSWSRIKPSKELTEKILVAIEQQKQSDQWKTDRGQFIPLPATWLNQERWDDEQQVGEVKTVPKCACGKDGQSKISGVWYCGRECRITYLGW